MLESCDLNPDCLARLLSPLYYRAVKLYFPYVLFVFSLYCVISMRSVDLLVLFTPLLSSLSRHVSYQKTLNNEQFGRPSQPHFKGFP